MSYSKSAFGLLLLFSLLMISHQSFSKDKEFVDGESVYVTTDRYVYNPAERIYFTGFVADDNIRIQNLSSMIKFQLVDGKGAVLDSLVARTNKGRFSYFFTLPSKGGVYYLKASTRWQLNQISNKVYSKEIFVQEMSKRHFYINQELNKVSYSLTDTILSELKISKRGDQPIDGLSYEASLMSEGIIVNQQVGILNDEGKANITFAIPQGEMENLFLKVKATYQGNTELSIKRIPFAKKNLQVAVFYPTGVRQLVADVKNTLVVKTFDEHGNNKDANGEIVDDLGNSIVSFESFHQGMCALNFVPNFDRTYFVRSNQALNKIELPKVEKVGVVWTMNADDHSLKFLFRGSHLEKKKIKIVGRGTVWKDSIYTQQNPIIDISKLQPGVYGITIFDDGGNIVGKRLWVKKPNAIEIDIAFDKKTIGVDESFVTTVNTNNELANFCLRIIDEQTLKQVKDESHNISSWFYLGAEILKTLKDPTFYFDQTKEKADEALRLLEVVSQKSWKRDFSNGKIKARQDAFYPRMAAQLSGYISQYYTQVDNIDKIKVRIKNTSYEVEVDKNGRFKFEGIPPEVVSQPVVVVAQKGIEKVEIQVPSNYNFFNNSFNFSLKPGELGFSERKLPNKEFVSSSDNIKLLTYKGIGLFDKDLIGSDNVRFERGDVAAYTIDASRVLNYTNESLSAMSIERVPLLYNWNFGYYLWTVDGYALSNEDFVQYNQPFRIQFDYSYNQSRRVSFTGPSMLNKHTPYWMAEAQSNDKGKFEQTIAAPTVSSGYAVICEGITASGKCFTTTKTIKVQDLVEAFVNVPAFMTKGDLANLDLQFINNSDRIQKLDYTVTIDKSSVPRKLELLPYERKSVPVELITGNKERYMTFSCQYTFNGKSRSTQTHSISLLDKGHRRAVVISGNQTSNKMFESSNVIEGSAELRLSIMNDFLDIIESTSARMIRQPHGCFEQVSSANYPNILALKILRGKQNFNTASVTNMINNGYRKLVAYETSQSGFEWYGANPPHTTLTAYGLLQFKLMKDLGLSVDEKMFRRNLKWLLDRRKKDGGYVFTKAKYGFNGSDEAANNAYVTWILSRITDGPLTNQITALEKDIDKKFDAYKMALLANVYVNRNRSGEAKEMVDKLIKHYQAKKFSGFKTNGSIMYSSGNSLVSEILALTLMAQHGINPSYTGESAMLITKLISLQTHYGFGNTQSTALSLEALSLYQSYFKQNTKYRKFEVWLGDKKLITHNFNKTGEREFRYILKPEELKQGGSELKVVCEASSKTMFLSELTWLEENDRVEHKELSMNLTFDKPLATLSEEVMATLSIINKTDKLKPQTVAVVRIPAGLSYDINDLNYLKKEGVFNHFESLDDQLVFYFLNLEPNEHKSIQLALKPFVAGKFSPAESYVYQYYSPHIRSSVIAKKITINQAIKP